MPDSTRFPYGDTMKYFQLDGFPARQLEVDRWPEVLLEGTWVPLYDSYRFVHEAVPISKENFDVLVEKTTVGTGKTV